MLVWAIPAAGADGGQAGIGVDDVGIEVAQDVVAAPGELTGHGDRRQLAVVTVLHRRCSRRGRGCAGASAFIAASNSAQRNVGGPWRVR